MVKLSVMPEIENVMQNSSSELGSKFLGFWFIIFKFLGLYFVQSLGRPTPPLKKNVEYVNMVD